MNTSKVVVITGASAGVGRATTRAFARHGAHIGLLARGKDRLEAVRAEVESLGGKGLVIPTDVAHPGEVEAAAESVEAKFGPIDIWVNNAMVTIFSPFSRISPEEYRRVTEVTYLGSVYGTMTALKRMMPRDSGTIVQVGSALAYRGIPLQSAYCGAKHALRGFIDSVRTELIHDKSKVHLTMVQLPALNTPQFSWSESRMPYHPQPVPPIYQPEVAADAIVWAAHHRHREVYVAGSTVAAVLGNKLIPGLVDHYLGRTGYSSQLTDRPVKPDRPSNLFAPASGNYGAHGIFGSKSRSKSWHFLVAKALGWTFLPDLIGGMASAATMGFSALRRAAK